MAMTREQMKQIAQPYEKKEKMHTITWKSGEIVEKPAVWRRSKWTDGKYYGYFYLNGTMTRCLQVGTHKWVEAEN